MSPREEEQNEKAWKPHGSGESNWGQGEERASAKCFPSKYMFRLSSSVPFVGSHESPHLVMRFVTYANGAEWCYPT